MLNTFVSTQMDNAFNLVEQGVYILEVFQDRRAKLTLAMEDLDMQMEKLQKEVLALETSETTQKNLIPQTEELLVSYDEMTNKERNELLKEILEEIKCFKGADGQIEIDLYPRLPRMQLCVGILNLPMCWLMTPPEGTGYWRRI